MRRYFKPVKVLCADGVTRTALVGDADTYFSAPARVQAHGRTVTGFMWVSCEHASDAVDAPHVLCFTGQGRNRAEVGLWPEQLGG